MNPSLLFLGIELALVLGAILLLLTVIVRRGRALANLFLAILLLALAIGVWLTAIRTPIVVP